MKTEEFAGSAAMEMRAGGGWSGVEMDRRVGIRWLSSFRFVRAVELIESKLAHSLLVNLSFQHAFPSTMHFKTVALAALTATSTYASPVEKRAAKVDELVGFAAGTTGGGSGAGTVVTSCAALTTAAKAGGVIKISGNLSGCGIVKLASDTSVLGVGANSGLTDGGLQVRKVSNVIIRNLKLFRAPQGKDLIDIDASTKVWVDHCDLSSVGLTGDKDTYDGLLDAKHGADMLTFSWNKFHDHVRPSP
jgi:pectate lyase